MRKKRFFRGRKRGHKRNRGVYYVSRGGIQLCLIAMLLFGSCTLKLRLMPTTIDVNSIEYSTDSLETFEVWETFAN